MQEIFYRLVSQSPKHSNIFHLAQITGVNEKKKKKKARDAKKIIKQPEKYSVDNNSATEGKVFINHERRTQTL